MQKPSTPLNTSLKHITKKSQDQATQSLWWQENANTFILKLIHDEYKTTQD